MSGFGKISQSEEIIRTRFGLRVRQMRRERGLSQDEFARMIGMDRSYLSNIENGHRNVTLGNLHRLSLGFGVPLGRLLDGIDVEFAGSSTGESTDAARP